MNRRRFLAALAAGAGAAALPRRTSAIGEASKFRIAQLALGGFATRENALARMAWEIDKRTSIDVALEVPQVGLRDEELFRQPFLYLAGEGAFAPDSSADVERLRRFLTFGGFLIIDSAEGTAGDAFDDSVRQLLDEVFERKPSLEALPPDHVIFKSFYLIGTPVGRLAIAPTLEAVIQDGRAVVVYTQNDLAGAWARDNFGSWQHECYPGGEDQREYAFRLGVNLAMYALCLDYKTDQVHVPFILKRRKWRPDDEL